MNKAILQVGTKFVGYDTENNLCYLTDDTAKIAEIKHSNSRISIAHASADTNIPIEKFIVWIKE